MYGIDGLSKIILVATVALMSATPSHAYLSLGPSEASQPAVQQPSTAPVPETPSATIESSNSGPAVAPQAKIAPTKNTPAASETPQSLIQQPSANVAPAETPQAAIEPSNTEAPPSEAPSANKRPSGNSRPSEAPKHTAARPAPAPAHPHPAETTRRSAPTTSRIMPVGGLSN